MNRIFALRVLPFIALVLTQAAIAGTPANPYAERTAPDSVTVRWTDKDAVDVYQADRPDAPATAATLVSGKDRDGIYVATVAKGSRPYFLLRDTRSGETLRVAERLLPLEQGSNFRDVGGYPAADGKHVRWGMIYRSGGTPLLTEADVQEVQSLGLKNMVDLRSSEERVIAPTRLNGIRYSAVGYSMAALSASINKPGVAQNGGGVYRNFPAMLAPQMRLLFDDLKRKEGPLAYNCSAGQDRTGFATAMILTVLGVPRDVIIADYHLSTAYRRPEFEMPKIDTVAQANNPTAMFFAKYQQNPQAAKPQPLKDPDGKPFLAYAFEEIEARWGSVDAYLEQEAGVTKLDIAALRATYLE